MDRQNPSRPRVPSRRGLDGGEVVRKRYRIPETDIYIVLRQGHDLDVYVEFDLDDGTDVLYAGDEHDPLDNASILALGFEVRGSVTVIDGGELEAVPE